MRLAALLGVAGICVFLAVERVWGQKAILLTPTVQVSGPSSAPVAEPAHPQVLRPEDLKVEKAAEPADAVPPVRIPEFLGDQTPIGSLLTLPRGLIQGNGVVFVPSVRHFQIIDNDSPQPRTRSTFTFNYLYNVFGPVNEAAGGRIKHTRIHREVFGWEWATKDGLSSIGLRVPINTYNAAHSVTGLDGTSTDVGDLSVIFKWLLWQDDCGRLLSAGLAVTPPTGPGSFAGSNHLRVFHNTGLQPFCGWIWTWGACYVQGFTAVDAVTSLNDVILLNNSLAAGYLLYQNHGGRHLTALVPTIEVHSHTPLNHRGVLDLKDPAGTPDMLNLTAGLNFEYRDFSSFGVAFAIPLIGPRMYDFEVLAQWRWRH